jgi:flagellar capping protein FliD
LNTAHAAANGTFSVSGSDLLFTYNHNTGNISNTNDTGLTYIPAPGTITQSVAGVDHPALNAVTAVSHVAGAASATLDGADMTLENGIFKITSGNARGIHITASGNNSASIYVGKSLFDTLKDFSDSVVKTNSDIDKKVGRYNSDIADYNEQLTALETRMENERARYIEQFTAMETAVSSFKETGSIIDNLMESWKASLS